MLSFRSILIYGFSLFSMFFGSGNLVFPLQIGMNSGADWLPGFAGLFITGIILPFMGLMVVKFYNGSYEKFFAEGGKLASIILPLFTLSLLGSFGVVPRCITVAYGGIEYIYSGLSLSGFSIIFSILCFFACLKDTYIIAILGKYVTPILLLLLLIIISYGVLQSPELSNLASNPPKTSSFSNGFLQGYATMDLFAAFFFSSFIFKQIQNNFPEVTGEKNIILAALWPSIVGAGLLAIIYLGFVYLGAYYAYLVTDIAPELILPTITTYLIGKNGAFLVAIVIVFSCLTTAVALNNIYARYLCILFKVNEKKFPIVLLVTTSISFCVSLLDFNGIAKFLAPVLEISYPGLIILTLFSIFTKNYRKLKIITFYASLIFMIIIKTL